jgi:hypothetical protein
MISKLDPSNLVPRATLTDMLHGNVSVIRGPVAKSLGIEVQACEWHGAMAKPGGGAGIMALAVTTVRVGSAAAAESLFDRRFPGWMPTEIAGADQALGKRAMFTWLGVRVRNVVLELRYVDPTATADEVEFRLHMLGTYLATMLATEW